MFICFCLSKIVISRPLFNIIIFTSSFFESSCRLLFAAQQYCQVFDLTCFGYFYVQADKSFALNFSSNWDYDESTFVSYTTSPLLYPTSD